MEYARYLRKLAGNAPIILSAAGAVVTNPREQLLLFKRSFTGVWSLPGGHMQIGESLEETAIRETFEETGVSLKNLRLIKVVSGAQAKVIDEEGNETYYVTAFFRSTAFSGKVRGSPEGFEVGFFSLTALPQPLSVAAREAVAYLKMEFG